MKKKGENLKVTSRVYIEGNEKYKSIEVNSPYKTSSLSLSPTNRKDVLHEALSEVHKSTIKYD